MIYAKNLLERIGFEDFSGLLLMHGDVIIPQDQWRETILSDGDHIILMTAIEGG